MRSETINAAKWGFIQKLTVQPIQLIYGMLLARLISPSEMGIVSLTAIFFAVATDISMAGFSSALIRKLDRTDADLNTMFWFNLTMSGIMGGALFLLAPWLASFYNQPELIWLTRISSFMLFISSSTGVHLTLFQCKRDFRTLAILGMVSTFAGMPVCLILALYGYGVWALLAQQVVSALVNMVMAWLFSPWKPRFSFSMTSFNELFGFGSKLAASSLLHTVYTNLRTFIIGKFYSPAQLGLYSRGEHLSLVFPSTVGGVLTTISYPIFANIQNDRKRLARAYCKYIKISSLVIVWFCITLAILAYPTIEIVYGKSWIPCAKYVQIISLALACDHLCMINLNLLKIAGRSGALLKLEVIKKSISIGLLIYASTISVEAICWAIFIYVHIAIYLNSYYSGDIIGLPWRKQLRYYMPYVALALLTSIPAYFLTKTEINSILQVLLGGSVSLVLYCSILRLFNDDALLELIEIAKIKLCKKRDNA